jgi:hypothetical protein
MAKYAVQDSATFQSQRQLLEKTVPRLKEALKGLEWALERKPYVFDKIEGAGGIRLAKLEALQDPTSRNAISVRVFFKLLPDYKVTLEWMEVIAQDDFPPSPSKSDLSGEIEE